MSIAPPKSMAAEPRTMICTACGSMAKPVTVTPGNFLTEILLYIFGVLPGILYSVWRIAKRHRGCPACGAGMIPSTSPVGLQMIVSQTQRKRPY